MDILLSFSVGDVEPLALEKHECLGAKSPLHNIENKDQLAWDVALPTIEVCCTETNGRFCKASKGGSDN
ncbi:hypothetical protein [Agrobacterium cavarae]|uniref:hypothetical protein n=1 Tax=Agrobacterium cavarae TaxID=2528239 RepID=UPI0013AEF868|nr:hypothetical protein [Agrobacterium cavarae]